MTHSSGIIWKSLMKRSLGRAKGKQEIKVHVSGDHVWMDGWVVSTGPVEVAGSWTAAKGNWRIRIRSDFILLCLLGKDPLLEL